MIDSHFHIWQRARGDYGWLTPALAPIYRDVTVNDWRAQAGPLGVTGGVLVQAAPTEAETAFLLRQAERHDAVQGVVGWVDLRAADAPQRIERLARHPKLKGLRPMLQDIADADWILQAAVQPALQAIAACDLTFDALIKPVHLPRILALAQRHPRLRIVIDHGAKPDIAGVQWTDWADGIQRIAQETSASCKLSGLWTEAAPGVPAEAMRPYAEHLLQCFGAQRVLWGSDWPVLELAASYEQWWREAQVVVHGLDDAARAAVFGGNARRVYRLKPLVVDEHDAGSGR